MKILLVILSDSLHFALTKVLNPANEYSAIVVDEPELAKKNLDDFPQLREKIYPFYELKECVQNNDYDLVLLMASHPNVGTALIEQIKEYGGTLKKFINAHMSYSNWQKFFLMERNLRYYKEHATEFDMIATGGCYGTMGLDTTKFRYKLFNISRNNQDFYYKYQVAKFIFQQNKNGGHLKYALTEISPFIFYFDLSKITMVNSILEYLIAFDDIHNFWLPIEEYKKLFREEFLNTRLPLDNIDLNNLFYQKADYPKCMDLNSRINARKRIDLLTKHRQFTETIKENVKIFDDYLTLCEENNVRSIIFHPPLHEAFMRYFDRETLNEFYTLLGEVLEKHPSAVFFDGWKLKGLSSDEYYSDVDHMNITYAAKFSTILNDFIEDLERNS